MNPTGSSHGEQLQPKRLTLVATVQRKEKTHGFETCSEAMLYHLVSEGLLIFVLISTEVVLILSFLII